MPRSEKVKKRILPPDPVYNSQLITRLINRVMRSGKKTVAQEHVYQAFELVKKKTKKEPLEIFTQALENIKPSMEVRPRRVGGAAYQVPIPVRGGRRETLAIRWLIQAAQARPNKEYHIFSQKLAAEILDAVEREGGAVKKKENIHRMAEANRAFAHFRW
ncbi:MAG TPA: 30S ribosomal protein S7 [Nevskiaceae bacterium]|nr:30S ribosomal protein S7 [Nevskiaceae bacterium]